MRKFTLILLTVILLPAFPALAQKGFYFGAGATGISTWIQNQNNYGLPDFDYRLTTAVKGNLTAGYDFNEHLGVKMEVGYGCLGQKYGDTQKDTLYSRRINLNYLMIPLMLKYTSSGDIARFYMDAGFELALLTSATQDYMKDGKQDTMHWYNSITKESFVVGEKDIKKRFNPLDVMFRLDLGSDITLTKNLFLNAGLTFSYGLMDINASDYHLKDYKENNYRYSHNFYCGLNVGINYKIPED
ncbi:MAG: outer membrane beta-barrel protein [Bacteroidota bacterium]|nr:outer membrane beta-barrel protein [Bacteroidota bacterium]